MLAPKRCDHGNIGRKQLIRIEIFPGHPTQLLPLSSHRIAVPLANDKELNRNDAIVVLVPQVHKRLAGCDLDTKLLGQLTGKRLGRRFTRRDLPSREFPETVEWTTAQPFGYENSVRGIKKNSSRNPEMIHAWEAIR